MPILAFYEIVSQVPIRRGGGMGNRVQFPCGGAAEMRSPLKLPLTWFGKKTDEGTAPEGQPVPCFTLCGLTETVRNTGKSILL